MDITNYFLKAKAGGAKFSNEELNSIVEELSLLLKSTLDWDYRDGENWGRLIRNDNKLLIFHSTLPIMIIHNSISEIVNKKLREKNLDVLQTLIIESWNHDGYSINLSEMKDVIGWHSSTISPDKFSMDEFWYATI